MRIETTQLYAKVTDKKVDEDMKRLKAAGLSQTSGLYEEDIIVRKQRRKSQSQLSEIKKRPCNDGRFFCIVSYPSLFFPASFICVVKNFLYV